LLQATHSRPDSPPAAVSDDAEHKDLGIGSDLIVRVDAPVRLGQLPVLGMRTDGAGVAVV
jgi:hypothetical protein